MPEDILPSGTTSVEHEGRTYLSNKAYSEKHGLDITETRYACQRKGLISIRRKVTEHLGLVATRIFVLDLPPIEHPQWAKYKAISDRYYKAATGKDSKSYIDFDKLAPIYLERFDEARKSIDVTRFRQKDIGTMLEVDVRTLTKWTEIGIAGYGKLPRVEIPEDKFKIYDSKEGKYVTSMGAGRTPFYYETKDIRRWLKKELADPNASFKTIDDVVSRSNIDDIIAEAGYYVYEQAKTYPMSYDGFMKWLKANILIHDKKTRKKVNFIPNGKQRELFENAFKLNSDGTFKYRRICISWPRGEGKCELKGNKAVMFDGTFKKVEDVVVGDMLMGDDSTPRKVLSVTSGVGEMFEVVPMRGKPFIVNKHHILSLKRRRSRHAKRGKPFIDNHAGAIVDISVEDYIKTNKWFKEMHLLYKVPVEWGAKTVNIDPYFIGLWLGDGHTRTLSITTADNEIVEYIKEFSAQYGVVPRVQTIPNNKAVSLHIANGNSSMLRDAMRGYNLFNNKHIPLDYKANTREIRLQVLAGLVDTDGYRNRNSIEITQKSEVLANDIAFLARSLGFHAEVVKCIKTIKSINFSGAYYRIGISGDCSIIPTKLQRKKCRKRSDFKDILVTGIREIRSVGIDEYYGFMLDGNSRYLMEDFTVTHNSIVTVLLFLFRFFNLPNEEIFLVANSEKQTAHLLYNEAKKLIQWSPSLISTPGLEIKEKGIFLMGGKKEVVSKIEIMSVESGTRSNATCFAFSEIYKMSDEGGFAEIVGSIRFVPNAWIIIESTVAVKGHVFQRLYESFIEGKDPLLYFSHYADEHHSPTYSADELKSFETIFLPGDFNRFFRNRWEDAATGLFDEHCIFEMGVIGYGSKLGPSPEMTEAIARYVDLRRTFNNLDGAIDISHIKNEMLNIRSMFKTVDDYISIPVTSNMLDRIMNEFNCEFIIGIGIDRAKAMNKRSDRTAMVTTAKAILDETHWVAFVLDIFLPEGGVNDDESLKDRILRNTTEFGFISRIHIEEYQGKDLYSWCIANGYDAELVPQSYKRQESMFTTLYRQIANGLYKCPTVPFWTDDNDRVYDYAPPSGMDDIFRVELEAFEHIPARDNQKTGRFGSCYKYGATGRRKKKGEPKDDVVYAAGHSIDAANAGDIQASASNVSFGNADFNMDTIGAWA